MEQEQEKLPQIVHSSWTEHLLPLFNDVKMLKIKYQLLPSCSYYPAPKEIFKVFSMPLQDIKVVILGQDPYPRGEATGLAFAVREEVPVPASLKVIHRELEQTGVINHKLNAPIGININNPKWKTLQHWVDQGVFLLNTALTVEAFKAGSHTGVWHWFVREVIKIISKEAKPIWLLWGAKAQSFSEYIQGGEKVTKDVDIELNMGSMTNMILTAPHPAAEFYSQPNSRVKHSFKGCNHFNLCNKILEGKKQQKINW